MGLLVVDVATIEQGDQHIHIQKRDSHAGSRAQLSSSRRLLTSSRSTGTPSGIQGSSVSPLR